MNRFHKLLFGGAVLGATLVLGLPVPAYAGFVTFSLRYSTNGGSTFTTVTDGSANDLDGTAGAISVNLGGVTVSSTALSFTSPDYTSLDLSFAGAGKSGPFNYVVQASLDGIVTAPPPQVLTYNFTGSGSSGLTKTMRTWIDDNNILFGTDTTPGAAIVADTLSQTVPGPVDASMQFDASVPYSMTTEIRLSTTRTTLKSWSLDSMNEIAPVPAPATLILAISGIPILGLATWFRRRRVAFVKV